MKRTPDSRRSLRGLLVPLAACYGGVIRLRNAYYDRVSSATHAADVPVVSVGNLTAGGTGKTPLTIEIVRRLAEAGHRPAILTRGYAAAPGEVADEVREFELALPQVPVVVDPDRVAGAQVACQEHGADCLVLDDGFQHRRLRRDLDIVLIDGLDPWGGGRLLPAGRLREPLESLRRADWVVITRSNQADPGRVQATMDAVRRQAPEVPITKAAVMATGLVGTDGDGQSLELLRERRILAVCGLGNPTTFEQLVADLGAEVCELVAFADHHNYGRRDAEAIAAAARRAGATWVVTTRKDWVKLGECWPAAVEAGGPELLRLEARLALADPQGSFAARLERLFEEHT